MLRRTLKYDGLTKSTTAVYGTGHVQNDLCAGCWFNYVLFYLVNIRNISDIGAGAVVLAGQIADGITTPLAGIISDRLDTRIGKRMPLFIGGTITVVFSFFFIWQECFICIPLSGSAQEGVRIFWYCFFAAVFNVGWASVQVAHLSLIPSLSPLKERKDTLIGLRTAFTYISNIVVLLLALLLFNVFSSSTLQFSLLSIICLVMGICVSLTFVIVIDEPGLTEIATKQY